MATRNVTFTKLAAKPIALANAKIVYEPSIYGGDGNEVRKNIVFEISEDQQREVLEIEEAIDSNKRMSCVKDGTVKVKLNTADVHVYNVEKQLIDHPQKWKGSLVNAQIVLRGAWASKTMSGLSLDCTDLQILDVLQATCPF